MDDIPAPTYGPIRNAVELTVTLFGDHDAIDQAISAELGRRGCRTHSISVETGWLTSTRYAVVRLDTAAGASALTGLTDAHEPGVHVVAVGEEPADPPVSNRLRHLCEECSATHDVSLLWHPPLGVPTQDPEPGEVDAPIHNLALAVADEIADQTHGSAPSFSIRSVAV